MHEEIITMLNKNYAWKLKQQKSSKFERLRDGLNVHQIAWDYEIC